jgi:hypothetical protein
MVENYSSRVAWEGITATLTSELTDIQNRFLSFQGQLCFDEISSEEQAIELYGMMKKQLFIDEELSVTKERISALYEAANTSSGSYLNVIATVFALISVALSLAAMKFNTISVSDVVYYEGDMAQAANKASWFIITRWIAVIAVLVILIVTPLKERIVKYAECVRGSIGRFFTKIWNAIKDKIFWRKK